MLMQELLHHWWRGVDTRLSFRHFCHLFCVVLFCCEAMFSQAVSCALVGFRTW